MKKYKYPISRLRGVLNYWKGKKMPIKAKRKMSKSKKGKIPSNLEILHSDPEIKKKRNQSLKKFWENPDYRQQFSKSRIGEKNPSWKGGRGKLQELIRKSLEYRKWKDAILKKYNYTSEIARKHNLQVHHLLPFNFILEENNIKTSEEALNCKELWDINNGVVLKKGHHRIITILEHQKSTNELILLLDNFIKVLTFILNQKSKSLKRIKINGIINKWKLSHKKN